MPPSPDIEAKIRAAAAAKNVDPDLAVRIAQAESSGQSGAQNPRSTAQGLFQVIDDTWKRYGGKPGKKFDVDENIRVGTDILADNTNKLRQMLGRDPQGHEIYTAHFFGPGTAKHVLTADANRPLNEILSQKVLNANPELKNQTTGEFLQRMQSKTGSKPAAATASRPAAPGSEPTASEKMMTDALKSGMSAQNLIKDAGPGYKAAMAMMFLADDKPETEKDDIWKEAEPEQTAEVDTEEQISPLASLDLSYQSPFPQQKQPPVQLLAHGGVVHRADGTPQEGEIATGGITDDTRAAFSRGISARDALRSLKEVGMDVGRGAISNAESLLRGAVSQVPGIVGDVESLARKGINFSFGPGGVKVNEQTVAPTSQEIRAAVPRVTAARPESSGMESMGEVMAPGFGKAAAPVVKATGKEAARQMLRGMEGEGPLASVSPPIMYAREPGKAAPQGIFTHLPSNEAPFVGRLDEYISNLPGPVQKQQLFGQLKGKFRDYEIGRAEEALKDLPDNAKLTPSDLLNRIKGVYDPGQYKTTVLPPDASSVNGYYRSMDNPFYNKDTDEGVHLGVIHLNQNVPPEVAQRMQTAHEAARAVKFLSNDGYVGRYPEKMDELEKFLKTSGVQFEPELVQKLDKGVNQYRQIVAYEKDMEAAREKLLYPVLRPEYEELHAKYAEQFRQTDPTMPSYVARTKADPLVIRDLGEQGNAWLMNEGFTPLPLPDFASLPTPGVNFLHDKNWANSIKNAFEPAKEHVAVAENNLHKYLKGTEDQFKKAIGEQLPYVGQHSSLGGGPSPISFSRFSEHTTDIPGIGKTEGIYVHELQSDLLDDLRKLGPKGGSMHKDTQEYNELKGKLAALQKTREEAYLSGNNKVAEEMDNQIVAAEGRARVLAKRLNDPSVDYRLPEAFSKMETGAKTTQQLMAKNAIAGAIQQGKNFVAFPGKESAQAQLYEKLPRNLKDVVKDLGPGFELRDVELNGPHGKSMHTAIVWGPEAAARIQKKGVPFATGGAVDKANIDHRKYM